MISSTWSRSGLAHLVDDPAVGEEHDAVGVRRGDRVVGDHHDRLAVVGDAASAAARAPRRRTRESRLPVGSSAKTIVGPADQRAGDRDPLLLAAGELVGLVGEPVTEPDGRDHLVVPLGVGLAAGDRQREQDVLLGGERRDQVVGLEDEADLVAAQPGQRLVLELGEVLVADEHRALVGGVERGAAVHQRRLAGPARPHHGGELAGRQVEGDVVEGDDARLARAVGLGQAHHARRCVAHAAHSLAMLPKPRHRDLPDMTLTDRWLRCEERQRRASNHRSRPGQSVTHADWARAGSGSRAPRFRWWPATWAASCGPAPTGRGTRRTASRLSPPRCRARSG